VVRIYLSGRMTLESGDRQWGLYMADGTNHKVWILRRSDLEIVGEFGQGGHFVGQFLRPHGMSIDSRGGTGERQASRRTHSDRTREPGRNHRHDRRVRGNGQWQS